MKTPVARWILLSKSATPPRSSHCLSVSRDGLLAVYGGEFKPRTPTDARIDASDDTSEAISGSVHVFNLKTSLSSTQGPVNGFTTLSPKSTSTLANDVEVPSPRVGASTVFHGDSLYLWGGRGGVDMAPLPHSSAGPWKANLVSSGTSVNEVQWDKLSAVNEEGAPEPRSYHLSVVHDGKMYIHAGCPASGRLGTLHSFDLQSLHWKRLADAPGPGRGGTALAVCTLPKSSDVVFVRYGGFAGYELPTSKDTGEGSIDLYSPLNDTWNTVVPSPDPTHGYPGARSVHGFAPLSASSINIDSDIVPLAVVYHGERDASSLGHAGAGTFWDDVWVLCYHVGEEKWAWKKAEVQVEQGGKGPEARGWFPAGSWADMEGNKDYVVMQGGLISSNERVADAWAMELSF